MSGPIYTVTIMHSELGINSNSRVVLTDLFNHLLASRGCISARLVEVQDLYGGHKYSGYTIAGTTFNGDIASVEALAEAFLGYPYEYPANALMIVSEDNEDIKPAILRPGIESWVREVRING